MSFDTAFESGRNGYLREILLINRQIASYAPAYLPYIFQYVWTSPPSQQRLVTRRKPIVPKLNALSDETLSYSAYAPAISHTTYCFIKHLDDLLRDKYFTDKDDSKKVFKTFSASNMNHSYSDAINKIIFRWQRSVDRNASYFH